MLPSKSRKDLAFRNVYRASTDGVNIVACFPSSDSHRSGAIGSVVYFGAHRDRAICFVAGSEWIWMKDVI
jgi:hypothetical protein